MAAGDLQGAIEMLEAEGLIVRNWIKHEAINKCSCFSTFEMWNVLYIYIQNTIVYDSILL